MEAAEEEGGGRELLVQPILAQQGTTGTAATPRADDLNRRAAANPPAPRSTDAGNSRLANFVAAGTNLTTGTTSTLSTDENERSRTTTVVEDELGTEHEGAVNPELVPRRIAHRGPTKAELALAAVRAVCVHVHVVAPVPLAQAQPAIIIAVPVIHSSSTHVCACMRVASSAHAPARVDCAPQNTTADQIQIEEGPPRAVLSNKPRVDKESDGLAKVRRQAFPALTHQCTQF